MSTVNSKKMLVVGGAGYVGSHCLKHLLSSGYQPIVLDSLIHGHKEAVPKGVPFYQGDMADEALLERVFTEQEIDVVFHFAAFAYVGESIEEPLKYYENNVAKTIVLVKSMLKHGVRKMVFSSTCATYGEPESVPIKLNEPQTPINPYGQTKLQVEAFLKDMASAGELSVVAFRYFNAAGAAADGTIGEDHTPESHLIPLAIQVAMGQREKLLVFGSDYDTPDGSCQRDYIHVEDLATAHAAAIPLLSESEAGFLSYNLATGTPTSVLEIIEAVESVSGKTVAYEKVERRPGDPATLYARGNKAREELQWELKYTDIKDIVRTAWNWHVNHPEGHRTQIS